MFPVEVYKVLHLAGVMMVFLALGGVVMHALGNGSPDHPWRKQAAMTHGIGLVLMLLGGFGMLARLQIPILSGWVILKFLIWVVLGGLLFLIIRKPGQSKRWWGIIILLGILAAYLANFKPF